MVGWKSLASARSISDYRRVLSPPTDCGRSPHAEGAKKENGRFVPLFGFANGLLAFLALAAVLDFLPVLRHRRAPTVWWGEERLLFTTRYASVRQKYGAWAFLLGVMVYEFIVVFNNSMARENWPWLQTRVSPVLDWVMYLCFGFKILLGTKYNGRSMVCAGLLYFVARWVYFNGQNIWWLGLCVALLAAKDVPLRRVMKAFLACGVPTLALVELLHFAGIIAPDAASERNGSYRLMFGYGHPNTFGGVMFGLLLAWVLLRRTRLTWPELAGVAAVGVFLMVGPKSRSAALCTFLLVLLLALAKLRTRRGLHPGSRPLAALCAATVPVLAAVSYILPLFVVKIGPWANDIGPGWLKKLDDLLTCRISLAWAAYRVFDIKIAGQMLPDWPALDNIFVYLLYLTGPVMVVLVCALMMTTLYGYARRRQWQAVACLLVMLAYGYMESQVTHLTSDPALLLLCGAVFALPRERWLDE